MTDFTGHRSSASPVIQRQRLYARVRREAEVYPVGLLHDLLHWRSGMYSTYRTLWHIRTYLGSKIRQGDWRAVRQFFNGYLAEPTHEDIPWRRCGHGWTRERAMQDLIRHVETLWSPDD